MIREITSASNKLIKELIALKKTDEKKVQKKVLVDGEDFVELAYQNSRLELLITNKPNEKYPDVDQIIVPDFILEKLSSNRSVSNIIGLVHFDYHDNIKGDRLVYLDGVQDPGNVGTIIRTALAFSYDGVILSKDSASIFNDKVISATKGALFSLPIYFDKDLVELKKSGYKIIGTSLKNAINYLDSSKNSHFILILGNEGQGMKEITCNLCDELVKISIDNIDSLNVAIAGGILMNHFRK